MGVRFYVVGSSLRGKTDHDLDLVGVMSAKDFEWEFGMTHESFHEEWKKEDSKLMSGYKKKVKGARLIIQHLFPHRYVDLKFIPKSMLYTPNEEVNICDLEKYK